MMRETDHKSSIGEYISNAGSFIARVIQNILRAVLGIGFGATVLFACWVALYDLLNWAKTGTSKYTSLADSLLYLGADLTPVYMPTDWYGLASVAGMILKVPLWVAVPAVGFFIYLWLVEVFGLDD